MLKVCIIGAGPAGLIAAQQLRRTFRGFVHITIIDKAPKGQIRCPTVKHPFFVHEDIAQQIGVPLKKVRVRESVLTMSHPAHWARDYSYSTTGVMTENAMSDFDGPVRMRDAWHSDTLVTDLFDLVIDDHINLIDGSTVDSLDFNGKDGYIRGFTGWKHENILCSKSLETQHVIINTIPIPALLKLLPITARPDGISPDDFRSERMVVAFDDFTDNPVINKHAEIIYSPDGECRGTLSESVGNTSAGWIRFANIFGKITMEFHRNLTLKDVQSKFADDFYLLPQGYRTVLDRKRFAVAELFTRFVPIDEQKRRALIYRLTSKFGIFSLGRFATWSYKRVDHLPADAAAIVRMIDKKLQSGEYANA